MRVNSFVPVLWGLILLICSCSGGNSKKDEKSGNESEETEGLPPQKEVINLADPTIFYDAETDTYYLYGTSGSDLVNAGFEVYTSDDLENWERQDALALQKNDVYGTEGFWAPQVFKQDDEYYMAYTANEHIAIAKSKSPLGPFIQEKPAPLHDKDYNMIDPYVFISDEGKNYLYYVRLEGGNWLFSAEMKDDFSDIVSGTSEFAINAIENAQSWENASDIPITEGPTIIKHDDLYYFFYSANHFKDPHYSVGYATSKSPVGKWKKYKGNPILSQELVDAKGTGHGDFFQDKTGEYYYVFHTHNSNEEVRPRRTAIIKGSFVPDKDEGADTFEFDADSFRYLESEN